MNKLVKYIRYCSYALVVLLTSCIRDGLDECPPGSSGKRIQFVYDYNMSYEDLFHRQVSRVDLYLFDENGIYISKLVDEGPNGGTFPRGYTMVWPEELNNAVQLVAFPGLHNGDGEVYVTDMIKGQSRMDDLYVRLKERNDNLVNRPLNNLWHGRTQVSDASSVDTVTISLLKNTNRIRIVLQSLLPDFEIDVNEFDFSLETINGAYDAYNTPADNAVWRYEPCYKENDRNEAGAVAEIHTLRLMADRENTLTIRHTETDTELVSLNLNRYINALKLQDYQSMGLQEYMDREDEYKLIIFLTKEPGPGEPEPNPDAMWVAAQIYMQPWENRDQDI